MSDKDLILDRNKLKETYDSAEAGNAEAQFVLGKHLGAIEPYFDPDGLGEGSLDDETIARLKDATTEIIPQRDPGYWFTKAAQQGHAKAMTLNAIILSQKGNQAGYIEWLEKAAEKGDGQAMWLLAVHYDQASENNRENPLKRLTMLFSGDKNRSAAIEWYKKTISDGDDEEYKKMAQSNLSELTNEA